MAGQNLIQNSKFKSQKYKSKFKSRTKKLLTLIRRLADNLKVKGFVLLLNFNF